ncbi:NDP-sugar synthase [Bacteroides sp. 51]|uniref:nucleotidyltransferase family protein n=1 Tax=Bacteroides sp. 51 TaxID=2302938 RepID=UPI0013D5D0A6|nr:NDP-sugar synthase [Bacteroides sp. 51]NDV81856.1 NDP-sugar synthase [Bacteroides sp. 51]
MNYAVIAAGQGSRLVAEGVGVSKPLLHINGERMIERLFRIFINNNAESVSVIINEEMMDVRQYLQSVNLPVPLNLVIKSTPDSLHSFYELSPYLQGGKFCLTTVDTIFREAEFSDYIRAFRNDRMSDALMGVTDYIDDEKPLYVQTNEDLRITNFLDLPEPGIQYVSGGIYGMNETVLNLFRQAMDEGLSRMRNFQRLMVQTGLEVKAFPFSKIVDVDHETDIRTAEEFIQSR